MNIFEATRLFEGWLGAQTTLVPSELKRKHEKMAKTPFHFLRGTFYRWAQLWPAVCGDVADAPRVLAVGDLHVASFGTWRDAFGRLIWGIDDFDEAWPLPYTNDLVRLAAGASLAADAEHLDLSLKRASDIILDAYEQQLSGGGRPFVLEEDHAHLRAIALSDLRAPQPFWDELDQSRSVAAAGVPAPVQRAFRQRLSHCGGYRIVRRTAGIGSLGHQRFVALANWRGGRLAYEAKATRLSAVVWAQSPKGRIRIRSMDALSHAVRAADPFVALEGRWFLHRLAPDIAPVDIEHLPEKRDDEALLCAMAQETANAHGGGQNRRRVLRDLHRRRGRWLHDAARAASRAVQRDWKEWRKEARR